MPMNQISPAAIGCDREIGRHGAEPGLPAAAEQPDRQPVPQDKQIGGTDAEHDERVPVRAIAKRPQKESDRYSCTVRVSTSPIPRRSRWPELA